MADNPIPRIRRARGFRLYDTEGKRYLDLYREGALLGHRAASALSAMKAGLSQGLAAELPSAWEDRLAGALRRLFPSHRTVRIYASREKALRAASCFLGERIESIHDPALDPTPPGAPAAALWRPFLPAPSSARVILPVLPFTVCGAPAPACFDGPVPDDLPGSDVLPGFLLAGALRALAALSRPPERQVRLGSAIVARALDGSPGWSAAGPYVRPRFPAAEYPRVHEQFLRAGVVLSPRYPGPSVLPGECTPGENRLLARLFAGVPGG